MEGGREQEEGWGSVKSERAGDKGKAPRSTRLLSLRVARGFTYNTEPLVALDTAPQLSSALYLFPLWQARPRMVV